jgi:hypothetical protein
MDCVAYRLVRLGCLEQPGATWRSLRLPNVQADNCSSSIVCHQTPRKVQLVATLRPTVSPARCMHPSFLPTKQKRKWTSLGGVFSSLGHKVSKLVPLAHYLWSYNGPPVESVVSDESKIHNAQTRTVQERVNVGFPRIALVQKSAPLELGSGLW